MRKDSIENYRENIAKEGLKKILHYSDELRLIYDDISNYMYKRKFIDCSKEMKSLHNKHKGERCFIVATGPSINKVDLKLLDGEIKFGINTIFKMTNINWEYYVVSDRIIWDVFSEKIMNIDTTLFLSYVAARHYLKNESHTQPNTFLIKGKKTRTKPKVFPKDISEYVYVNSPTVVYIAIQIAYYLGFNEVYLLGCDCDYSGGHFDGDNFAKTSKMQIGDAEKKFWSAIFRGYEICKKVFEQNGRKIINCTDGGKLEVFERKYLKDVLKNG